jgi:hypothetical protein
MKIVDTIPYASFRLHMGLQFAIDLSCIRNLVLYITATISCCIGESKVFVNVSLCMNDPQFRLILANFLSAARIPWPNLPEVFLLCSARMRMAVRKATPSATFSHRSNEFAETEHPLVEIH